MTETDNRIRRKVITIVLLAFAGGVIGYFSGYAFGASSDELGVDLTASMLAALCVAIIYIVAALMVLVGTLFPSFGANVLNVEDADELREVRAMVLNSGLALVLWGAALAVLALAAPHGPISAVPAVALAVTALASGIYFTVISYRHSDELMMAVNRESSVIGFALAFFAIGGWAILAHTALLPSPAPLDIVTLFYAVTLVATIIATGRRGMLKLR